MQEDESRRGRPTPRRPAVLPEDEELSSYIREVKGLPRHRPPPSNPPPPTVIEQALADRFNDLLVMLLVLLIVAVMAYVVAHVVMY